MPHRQRPGRDVGEVGPALAAALVRLAKKLPEWSMSPLTKSSSIVVALEAKTAKVSERHPTASLVIPRPEQCMVGFIPAMSKSHKESWTPFDADPDNMYRQLLGDTSRLTSQGNQNQFKVAPTHRAQLLCLLPTLSQLRNHLHA